MNEQAGIRNRSYAPGDWYGVIGSRVTVVLPPQERARVAALWALVDDGAGFDEVLDALISGGLRDLSGFVLLSDTGDVTLAVVRGSARVSVVAAGEQVELAGSQSTTWVERSLAEVTSLVVELHDVPDTARTYAIEHGLVRLGRLSEGAAVDEVERPPLTTTGAVAVPHDLPEAGSRPTAAGPEGADNPGDPDGADADGAAGGAGGARVAGGLLHGAPPALVVAVGHDLPDGPGADPDGSGADPDGPGADPDGPGADPDGPADEPTPGAPATAGAEDLLPLSTAGADPLSDPLPEPLQTTDAGAADQPASTVLGASEPVRADESLVAFGAAPDVDSWIDPGPASAPDLAGPDPADHEVTEVLALDRPVDPEGTEPFSPLEADDLVQDVDPGDRLDGEGDDVDHGDDPLGLRLDIGSQDGPEGLDGPDGPDSSDGPGDPEATDAWADDGAGHDSDDGVYDDSDDGADDEADDGAGDDADDDAGGPAYGPGEVGPDARPDHDGATRTSPWDEAGLSLVRPGIPGQEPAPAVTSRPVARLLVSDGRRIEVDRVVVLGRAPFARRSAAAAGDGDGAGDGSGERDGDPLLVRVDSPHQEISATHVEIRPGSGADHGTAVVTDLGSTNGTVVAQPGFEPEELQPGVPVQLIPGAIIDLGDGVTLQVVRP